MVFSCENRTSRRRISPVAFNVKAILEVGLCFDVGQLPETRLFQATVASEDFALWADNWPGGDGGEFVLSIWFVKCPKRHIQTAQPIKAVKKLAFIGNANDDKMRMRTIGWKKRFADFKNSVARLDDLLGEGQVGPDE